MIRPHLATAGGGCGLAEKRAGQSEGGGERKSQTAPAYSNQRQTGVQEDLCFTKAEPVSGPSPPATASWRKGCAGGQLSYC